MNFSVYIIVDLVFQPQRGGMSIVKQDPPLFSPSGATCVSCLNWELMNEQRCI